MKKLNKKDYELIKQYLGSKFLQKFIAEEFKVSQPTVSKIKNSKSYEEYSGKKFIPFTAKAPAQELKEVLKQSANRIEELEKEVRYNKSQATKYALLAQDNEKKYQARIKDMSGEIHVLNDIKGDYREYAELCKDNAIRWERATEVWRKAAIGFLTAWGVTIVGGVLLILSLGR